MGSLHVWDHSEILLRKSQGGTLTLETDLPSLPTSLTCLCLKAVTS